MSTHRDEFCRSIKEQHPVISAKADVEYEKQWGDDVDNEYYSYSWFESLANAINKEMNREVPASEYQNLLAMISSAFESGDEAVRKSIDVAFIENLFWQVSPTKSASYWAAFPENLKRLYIDFHSRSPL